MSKKVHEGKSGVIILEDREKIKWERSVDKNGNEYFVFTRVGYPPLVRRQHPGVKELLRAYLNDAVVKLRKPKNG